MQTLAPATALFFVGHFIVGRSEFLQRYSIPVPVVGGVVFAVATAGALAHVQLDVDASPKDPLLLAFFATLGLGADVRSLAKGGRKLVVLLLLFVAMMVMQNAIGLGMAWLRDLHPLVGLLGGSISLIVLVNAAATAAFAYFVTSLAMGSDYDAAVGMSVMQTLTDRYGPAPSCTRGPDSNRTCGTDTGPLPDEASKQIDYQHTESHGGLPVVVVEQALAVTREHLHVSFKIAEPGHSVSRGAQHVTESAVLPAEVEQLPDLSGYLKFASHPAWLPVQPKPS